MADDTATRVTGIIAEHLCLPERPAPTDNLIDDLGADSLDAVEITMAMEEEFGIGVSDDETEACSLVQDWTKLVDEKVAAKA